MYRKIIYAKDNCQYRICDGRRYILYDICCAVGRKHRVIDREQILIEFVSVTVRGLISRTRRVRCLHTRVFHCWFYLITSCIIIIISRIYGRRNKIYHGVSFRSSIKLREKQILFRLIRYCIFVPYCFLFFWEDEHK